MGVRVDIQEPLSTAVGRVVILTGPTLTTELARGLAANDIDAQWHANDQAASAALEAWQPHALLVDLEASDGRLPTWATTPAGESIQPFAVMCVTRRTDLAARLAAFADGADDVLVAPFAIEELTARVRAHVRRVQAQQDTHAGVLRAGDLEIDMLRRRVRLGGRVVQLTPLQHNVLYILVARAGQVVTRDEILHAVWGADYAGESNVVDRHVRDLRARLGDDWRDPRVIATVPGLGYRFAGPAPVDPPFAPADDCCVLLRRVDRAA
jgi:DNA-binding response OmpR family regulator